MTRKMPDLKDFDDYQTANARYEHWCRIVDRYTNTQANDLNKQMLADLGFAIKYVDADQKVLHRIGQILFDLMNEARAADTVGSSDMLQEAIAKARLAFNRHFSYHERPGNIALREE